MTDETKPTPDELLEDEARSTAHLPPERIADAEGLPDDVRDGRIEDAGDDHGADARTPEEI